MNARTITTDESGQTMTEFAIILPVLVVLLFGIIQFGIAFMHSVTLTDAVRAGARKAAVSRTAANPTQAATTAVLGAATDLDPSKLSVNVTSSWVSGNTVTVNATYPYQINLLGIVVASGSLHSSTTERVE